MAIDIQTGSMGEADIFYTSKERAVDKFGNPIVELGNIPDNYREGYRQYIEKNPQPQFGTGDIRDVTLPDGSNVRFSSGTSAGHFEGYLRSIGQEPIDTRTTSSIRQPANTINPDGSTTPNLPGGGMYTAVQPQDGNEYRYTSEGVRYQVPIGSPPNFGIPEIPRPPGPTPQPTLTDPSQFAQAQVGAAVRQPSLPTCLLYTSPSPRDGLLSRMPSSA